MRAVDKSTITAAFLASASAEISPRLRFVLERLATHLHGFAREVDLTHAEWQRAIELLAWAGRISDEKRNEFILFSDVLGLSSLVDLIGSAPGGTPSSVLGPFHIRDAPTLEVGGDLKRGNAGETVFVQGRVRDAQGRALAGATLDFWQTAANGLYSNQDPAQAPFNLRTRQRTNGEGRYGFTTVRPAPYTVPDDGPVGVLLKAMGRHPWRPAHFHFIVEAPGFAPVVTELFPADDPYLDSDAVFGVREKLIVPFRRASDAPAGFVLTAAPGSPFFIVDFDFVLAAR